MSRIDNGYHIGTFRMQPGKGCGYEMDVHLPLLIRGPGIGEGVVVPNMVTTHTDLSPLIMSLVGEPPRPDFDGLAFPVTESDLKKADVTRHEHVNIEFWGRSVRSGMLGLDMSLTCLAHRGQVP